MHRSKSFKHRKHLSESRVKLGCSKGVNNPMYGKGYKISGSKNGRARKVLCIELNITYDCCAQAAKELNLNQDYISACARGVQKTTGGYHWRYIDDNN